MGKKGKEAKRREKKQRTGKKHLSLKPHEYYEISGDSVTRKRKGCPRCGPGTILSEHKGRLYCGKCGYTEFERKAPVQESVQEKKPGQPNEGQPSKEINPSVEDKPVPEKPQEEKQAEPQKPG